MGQGRALGAPTPSPAPGGVRRASLKRFSQPSPPTSPAQPPSPKSCIEMAPAGWHHESLKSAGASQSSLSCMGCPSLILADPKRPPGSPPPPPTSFKGPSALVQPVRKVVGSGDWTSALCPATFRVRGLSACGYSPPLPSATKPVSCCLQDLCPGSPVATSRAGSKGDCPPLLQWLHHRGNPGPSLTPSLLSVPHVPSVVRLFSVTAFLRYNPHSIQLTHSSGWSNGC